MHEEYWSHHSKLDKFNPTKREPFKSEIWALNKIKNKSLSVLDIGCGSGHFLTFAPERIKITKYTGIDISNKQIDQAIGYWGNFNFNFPVNFIVSNDGIKKIPSTGASAGR